MAVFKDPKYASAEAAVLQRDPLELKGMWTYRAETVRREYVWRGFNPYRQRVTAIIQWTGSLPQMMEFGHLLALWGWAAGRDAEIDQWRRDEFGGNSWVHIGSEALAMKRGRSAVDTTLVEQGLMIETFVPVGMNALLAMESVKQADAGARAVVQQALAVLSHTFNLREAPSVPDRLPNDLLAIWERVCWPGDPEVVAGYQYQSRELLEELNAKPSSCWPVDGKPPTMPGIRPLPSPPGLAAGPGS